MGGEKNKELEGVWLPMGSPPRRRGKVVHCAAVRALRGITPRVGGEKPFLFCGGSSDSGSPPHRRGKVRRIRENLERVGITPAWAGKRAFQSPPRTAPQDHPRAGREKQTGTVYAVLPYGSPLRRRGKEQGAGGRMAAHGITPAQAGKRRQSSHCLRPDRDHPRAGGEKQTGTVYAVLPYGSPPRRHGKEQGAGGRMAAHGITPA